MDDRAANVRYFDCIVFLLRRLVGTLGQTVVGSYADIEVCNEA